MLTSAHIELLFVLPAVVLHGALATREFCKRYKEEVRRLAESLDRQAGLSDGWCLHPPTLRAAYQQWCGKQTYIQIFPWVWFVYWALVSVKLYSKYDSCMPVFWTGAAMAALTFVRSVLESRLEASGKAAVHGATVAVRFASMGLLLAQRHQCFLNVNDTFFSSRLGMLALSAAYVLLYCAMIPVPLEYSFLPVALNVPVVFIIFSWKFLLVKTGGVRDLVWADWDLYTVVGALASSCIGGQLYVYIRYSIGTSNMKCFLKAQR